MQLEMVKARHALELATTANKADPRLQQKMKDEIQAFVDNATFENLARDMQDVYTTDHVAKTKKYNTLSKEEDKQFFEYLKSVEEYNASGVKPDRVDQFESGRYERGSLKQRLFEPLAGGKRQENGTLFYEVHDKDLSLYMDEARMRREYERTKDVN